MNHEPKPDQPKSRDELAREIMRAANKLNWSAQATLNNETEPIDEKAYAAILEWRDKVNLAITSLGLHVTQENIRSRQVEQTEAPTISDTVSEMIAEPNIPLHTPQDVQLSA